MTNELHVAAHAVTEDEPRLWFFENAILDERKVELRVDGEQVDIERKPFEVLRFLLQHSGEVVTKDELLAQVWPGRILSESVLSKCVGRLREVLRDETQRVIKTVYGYGYRLDSQVRMQSGRPPPPSRFDLKPGDRPPGRPLWTLVRRLGAGAHGEAWLGRHDKMADLRVFKFAVDAASLAALKREITLSRLLKRALGNGAPVVELLDWNLEQAPFFIETRYSPGGNLADWATSHGGLTAIPLQTRVELAAQVADALAAVHSVGVLHKDLKPSNILIDESADGRPSVRLADFGSGGLSSPDRLEQLGISRLGFTATAEPADGAVGTLLYVAPEVLAGHAPTMKGDVYAFGVMLYQLIVGNFRLAMSPGWERNLDDDLLREYVEAAAQGDPSERLGDCSDLASRLRSLDSERERRAFERAAKDEAEQAALFLERLRARRASVTIALGALALGLCLTIALYLDARSQRERAERAAARAQSVSEFMSRDLLASLAPGQLPRRDLTVRELLDSAAEEIDRRFAGQPDTGAEMHAVLGRAYLALDAKDLAQAHLGEALRFYERQEGSLGQTVLLLASEILPLTYAAGTIRIEVPRFEAILGAALAAYGPADPRVFPLRVEIGRAYIVLGQWARGARELESALAAIDKEPEISRFQRAQAELVLGHVLVDLARFADAEKHLRHAHAQILSVRGQHHPDMIRPNVWLARLLIAVGKYEEGGEALAEAEAISRKWVKDASGYVLTRRLYQAESEIEKGQFSEAIPVLRELLETTEREYAIPVDASQFLEPLAVAYFEAARLNEAASVIKRARENAESFLGPGHPRAIRIRIEQADIERALGNNDAAWAILHPGGHVLELGDVPTVHPIRGKLLRVTGLLQGVKGKTFEARASLEKARQVFESTYGHRNWRTIRVHAELAGLDDPG